MIYSSNHELTQEICQYLNNADKAKVRLLNKSIQSYVDQKWFPDINVFTSLHRLLQTGVEKFPIYRLNHKIMSIEKYMDSSLFTYIAKHLYNNPFTIKPIVEQTLPKLICKLSFKARSSFMDQDRINALNLEINNLKFQPICKTAWFTKVHKKIFDELFGGINNFLKLPEVYPSMYDSFYGLSVQSINFTYDQFTVDTLNTDHLHDYPIARGLNYYGLLFFALQVYDKEDSHVSSPTVYIFNNSPENPGEFWINKNFAGYKITTCLCSCDAFEEQNFTSKKIQFNYQAIETFSSIIKGTHPKYELYNTKKQLA